MVNVPDGLPANHPRDRGFSDQELAMIGMRDGVEHLLRSLQRKMGGVFETRYGVCLVVVWYVKFFSLVCMVSKSKLMNLIFCRIPSDVDDEEDDRVDCIISDVFVTWSSDVAASFGLPLVSVYTANATSASVLYHTRFLVDKGIIPFAGTNVS